MNIRPYHPQPKANPVWINDLKAFLCVLGTVFVMYLIVCMAG